MAAEIRHTDNAPISALKYKETMTKAEKQMDEAFDELFNSLNDHFHTGHEDYAFEYTADIDIDCSTDLRRLCKGRWRTRDVSGGKRMTFELETDRDAVRDYYEPIVDLLNVEAEISAKLAQIKAHHDNADRFETFKMRYPDASESALRGSLECAHWERRETARLSGELFPLRRKKAAIFAAKKRAKP